jgi:hypothetical protein
MTKKMSNQVVKELTKLGLIKFCNQPSTNFPNIYDAWISEDGKWLNVEYLQYTGFTEITGYLLG